ncbi:matrix metalloproteinase-2-like isoform X2 [Ischnura elegans]|nr:matrix metalloproteinase-2-like isoform X2 [Ischnura elegans]
MCLEEGEDPTHWESFVRDQAGRSRGKSPASASPSPRQLSDDARVEEEAPVGGEVCFARGDRPGCRRRRTWMVLGWWSWTAVVFLLLCLSESDASPTLSGDEEENVVGRTELEGRSSRRKRDYITDSEQKYLMNFGYLPESNQETGNLMSAKQLHEAIANLQKFAGLPPTGKFDEKTKRLLLKPRCGLKDYETEDRRRKKRYVLRGPKWEYTNLTWSLKHPPRMQTKSLDPRAVQRELKEALEIWAEHSKLTFQMVNHENADIVIEFSRDYHGDGFPFDGRGRILAHAFFPASGQGGDAHFDDDEVWLLKSDMEVMGEEAGTSLFMVAAHEFGHSLGLSHSSTEGALMYPWYQGSMKGGKYSLPDDDKYGIQQLYGAKEERPYATRKPWVPPPPTPATTRAPRTHRPTHRTAHGHTTPRSHYPHHHHPTREPSDEKPDTCDTNYDAISMIRGELFIFKDRYFWRINDRAYTKIHPIEMKLFFYDLPKDFTHIDAVYERKDQKIVFFIGNKYYLYNGHNIMPGYPRPLTDLGLPSSLDKVDGAMVWGHNSKTYLFSGTMYWRLDESTKKVELDYPRDMKMWRGVDYNIDSVFKYTDGITYFFKGKGYWAFDDRKMRVRHKVQKLSALKWMKCPVEEDNILRPSQEYDLEERYEYSGALPCRTQSAMHYMLPLILFTLSVINNFPH